MTNTPILILVGTALVLYVVWIIAVAKEYPDWFDDDDPTHPSSNK